MRPEKGLTRVVVNNSVSFFFFSFFFGFLLFFFFGGGGGGGWGGGGGGLVSVHIRHPMECWEGLVYNLHSVGVGGPLWHFFDLPQPLIDHVL